MKSLLHLLNGDIRQIRSNWHLTEKDNRVVSEMQGQLLNDKDLCGKLGWSKYDPSSKILKTKAYLLALENYISIIYGKKEYKEDKEYKEKDYI